MKVLRNYLYNAGYQVLAIIVPLITSPYISRVLHASGVGDNAYTNSIIQYFVMFAALAAAVFCLYKAAGRMGSNQEAESLKQLDTSIRKAMMTCYATEGVYPPTIQYLKDNYGVQVDETRFVVFYEVFWENMMPDITVMERQD